MTHRRPSPQPPYRLVIYFRPGLKLTDGVVFECVGRPSDGSGYNFRRLSRDHEWLLMTKAQAFSAYRKLAKLRGVKVSLTGPIPRSAILKKSHRA
jgi:hypothetical protein